jgi:hypothetical protein
MLRNPLNKFITHELNVSEVELTSERRTLRVQPSNITFFKI